MADERDEAIDLAMRRAHRSLDGVVVERRYARPLALRALEPIIRMINGRLARVASVNVDTMDDKIKRVVIEFD